VLSAPLRLALNRHAASNGFVARHTIKKTPLGDLRGFLI